MRRATATLQNSDGSFNRKITIGEGERLINQGNATFVGRHASKPGRMKNGKRKPAIPAVWTWRLVEHPEPKRSIDEASPPSITSADMMANVGITRGLGAPDRQRIAAAKAKISEFALSSPRHVLQAGTLR